MENLTFHTVSFEDPENIGATYEANVPQEDFLKIEKGDLETIQTYFLKAKELNHRKMAMQFVLKERNRENRTNSPVKSPCFNSSPDESSLLGSPVNESTEDSLVIEYPTLEFDESENCNPEQDTDTMDYDNDTVNGSSSHSTLTWTSKIPTPTDKRATEEMLILIKDKFQAKLKDKSSRKKELFLKIYEELTRQGFIIAKTPSAGAERVHQKWRNLEKSFIKYESNMKTTGAGRINKPTFYDLLYDILGKKHKVHPPNLSDSFQVKDNKGQFTHMTDTSDSNKNTDENEAISKSKGPTLSTPKKTAKPKTAIEEVNQTLHRIEVKQEERFARMEKLLEEQNKESRRSNDLFELFIKKKFENKE